MRIALSWLRQMVELPEDLDALRHTCDLAGLEVASIEDLGARMQGVVAGQIAAVNPMEGTRLHRVEVDCGPHGTLVAVSGAPDVGPDRVGARVATGLVGSRFRAVGEDGRAQDVVVAARTLRGVQSECVLLSERELGLSEDHGGVYWLADELAPGAPLGPVLGDTLIEFELTPDLGRCFSAWGLARELGALLQTPSSDAALTRAEVGAPGGGAVPVIIAEPALCHRYLGAVLHGLTVQPSPPWMQQRLLAGGMRPINNLVDVGNYVMLELGQPLHFFDLDALRGPRIDVRHARAGEVLDALDQQRYELEAPSLVIADASGPVAVAGVIGGRDSAVKASTTRVLLEAAHFASTSVRRTCQSLRLRTDAAERYIKGVDAHGTHAAMARAIQLVLELCPGATLEGYQEAFPVQDRPAPLELSERDVARLLGIELPRARIAALLEGFGFECHALDPAGSPALRVTPPTFRSDCTTRADLIEEVARAHGLNQIPPAEIGYTYLDQRSPGEERVASQRRAADLLCGLGFSEAINYSLVSRELDAFGADFGEARHGHVTLANPLSQERDVMRTTLAPGLLRNVADNLRYRAGCQLFELGRAYLPQGGGEHREVELIGLVSAGERRRPYWGAESVGTAVGEVWQLFDLVGALSALFARFGLDSVRSEPAELEGLTPGQSIRFASDGQTIGYAGEVDAPWRQRLEIDGGDPVLLAEVRLDVLEQARRDQVPTFARLPTQPAVLRDLSVLVSTEVPARTLLDAVRAAAGPALVRVELFDRYQGRGVPEGHQSLAFHLAFQLDDRTLAAAEVDAHIRDIVEALRAEHGAELRG